MNERERKRERGDADWTDGEMRIELEMQTKYED